MAAHSLTCSSGLHCEWPLPSLIEIFFSPLVSVSVTELHLRFFFCPSPSLVLLGLLHVSSCVLSQQPSSFLDWFSSGASFPSTTSLLIPHSVLPLSHFFSTLVFVFQGAHPCHMWAKSVPKGKGPILCTSCCFSGGFGKSLNIGD